MRLTSRLFALFLVPLMFAAAEAQYTNSYGYSFNNPVSATCNQFFWDKMNARLVYRVMLKKRGYTNEQLGRMSTDQMLAALGGKSAAQTEMEKPLQGAASSFKPAPRFLLLPAMTQSLVNDKAQQQALLEVFEQGLKAYEVEAAKSGLSHDVAGAMAFLIAASYYVFNNGVEPDENGVEILARAIQRNMDTDEVRKIADSDKQKFYELMVALGTYLSVAFQQGVADNDAELIAQIKTGAAEALKGFLKMDPAKVRITSIGLEVAK